MDRNQLCLEEYLDFLKSYTADKPYEFTYDSVPYAIYYIASAGEETKAMVPIGGNYDISGNNTDGYIVTYKK